MREDMARVIVERPRIPAFNSRKGRDRPLEEMPPRSTVLRALGGLGVDLMASGDWKARLSPLEKIDWSKKNPEWENICIVANSVVSNRQARAATKAFIKSKLRGEPYGRREELHYREGGGMTRRASPSGITLSVTDAALIKGMLHRGDRQHDIAAWFGVNGGRIAEIAVGARFADVQAADAAQLPPRGPYPKTAEALAAIESLVAAKAALATAEITIRRFTQR